jgi:hypothetical protein
MSKFANLGKGISKVARLLLAMTEGVTTLGVDEVMISDRAVGGKVELVGTDGTLSPIPDGTYLLSDDFRFTVKDGFITEIGDAATPATETPVAEETLATEGIPATVAPEVVTTAVTPAEVEDIQAKVDQLATMLATLAAQMEELVTLIKSTTDAADLAATNYDGFKSELTKLSAMIEADGGTVKTGSQTKLSATQAIEKDRMKAKEDLAATIGNILTSAENNK